MEAANLRVATLATLLLLLAALPLTGTAADEPDGARRPRIGLVLGGGGARGMAHVGVLKVLEELRIPVDVIAGTSMGAVVGGLYASGMSTDELEHEVTATDWAELFRDSPERVDRSFHRKRDDDLYAFRAKPGFNGGEVQLPLAYIRGQKFDLLLNRLTLRVIDVKDFDRLPIPFRAVATDLETGAAVVLGHGSMAQAIRASLAVPGAFDPVEIDNRLLADGGLANNIPVNVAREMGADVVIVVDVGAGLYKRKELTNAIRVAVQLTGFLFTLNGELQVKTLQPRDVLIRPDLGDMSGSEFERAAEAIRIGTAAANAARAALLRYSVSPEEYARYRASRTRPKPEAPQIEFVRIDNRSRLSDAVIARHLSAPVGAPLDTQRLEREISTVYGLDLFESVHYDVVEEDDRTGLLVSTKPKSWGPNYLQFGLATSNDFRGDSTLRIGALYSRTAINSLNGEWRTGVQLGDEPTVLTELYQPLEPSLRYFAYGQVGYATQHVNVFDDAGNNTSRYQFAGPQLQIAVGRDLGSWGEGRIGYRRERNHATLITGEQASNVNGDRGEAFMRIADDTMDNIYFPHTGHLGFLEWSSAHQSLGSSARYDKLLLSYVYATSWDANTLVGEVMAGTTFNGDAPLESQFPLGGFLRLSGLAQDELRGRQVGLLGLIYTRRLSAARLFTTHLGISAELGNVWQHSRDVSLGSAIAAGSIFLGFDTPIGPLYLAYGRDEHGSQSVYTYVGPRFTF